MQLIISHPHKALFDPRLSMQYGDLGSNPLAALIMQEIHNNHKSSHETPAESWHLKRERLSKTAPPGPLFPGVFRTAHSLGDLISSYSPERPLWGGGGGGGFVTRKSTTIYYKR